MGTNASLKHDVFSQLTPDAAYWVGFTLADGCVFTQKNGKTPSVMYHIKGDDVRHLAKLRTFLGCRLRIQYTRKTNSVAVQFGSKQIAEDLSKYGVVPNKTHTAKVSLLEYDNNFWRGVVDGDGTMFIDKKGTARMGIVGSKDTCLQFLEFAKMHTPTLAKVYASGSIYSIRLTGTHAKRILKVLYGDSPTTYLDRKYQKALSIIAP